MRRLRHVLTMLLAVTVLLLGGCMEMDGFLFNTETLDRYHPPASIAAEDLTAVTFESEGHTLHGYWARSRGLREDVVVLYCHGNKHNMDAYWDRIEFLLQLGVTVFTFDYRGFGLSEGTSSEAGMHADAEAALAVVRARGFADSSIVLYGFSLGNVASIHLASTDGPFRTLIAESPFASSTALVQGGMSLAFPERWLTEGTFDNATAIRDVTIPLLLMHGEKDDFVRYRDNGRVVFENANEPKRRIVVPEAVHDNVPQTMGLRRYLDEIGAWMRL